VTTSTTRLQTHSAAVQQLIHQAAERCMEAGEKSDSADRLGIDDGIALVHDLIDLSLQGWAALVECVIKGPGSLLATSQATEPLASEEVEVNRETVPRQIEVVGSLERVGMPKVTIPGWCIGFKPSFLPAGVTKLQLVLKDYSFVGHNYTGKIRLSADASANIPPFEKVVTVGL
jgi:hypothetical protein